MRHIPLQLHAVGSIASADLAAAATAARHALDPEQGRADAVDAALDILHDRLEGVFVAALALEHGRLWIVRARGYTMIPEGLDATEGIVGRAVTSGRPQLVPDVSRDADFVEATHGVASELALPLLVGGDVVGVLNIETCRPLPPDAVELTRSLADALAPAVNALRGGAALDLSALARFFVYVGSLRDHAKIAEVTARMIARALPLDECHVLVTAEGGPVEVTSWCRLGEARRAPGPAALAALGEDVELGAVFRLAEIEGSPVAELAAHGLRSAAVLPLRANGTDLGTVIGLSRSPLEYRQRQAETAALVAAHAAASIESALALARERQTALTDSLTGLLNRRGFHEMLETEIELHHDDRSPVSLAVMDLDDFKEINDRAGHEFGDALLQEIGVVLPTVVAERSRAGRLGGDEFGIVLPATGEEDAGPLADELRKCLVTGLADAGFPIHVSLGVATYPFDGGNGSQLLRAADQALYEAKAWGKNRVVRFRDVVDARAGGQQVALDDRRRAPRPDAVSLPDVLDAATTITTEATQKRVLERLAKAVTFVSGGTGCVVSRIDRGKLVDLVAHALRDVDLGEDTAYLIDDFPVTREVLERAEPRSISFLDEDLDQAEAFVLRELRMNACLLVPIVLDGGSWGLVEVYDMRLRRFGDDSSAAVGFLAAVAAARLDALGEREQPGRRLPLFRLPSAG